MSGGTGDDVLWGGRDGDTLDGGAGVDRLSGGAGADTFVLRRGGSADIVADFGPGLDRIAIDSDVPGWREGRPLPDALWSVGRAEETGGQFVLVDGGTQRTLYWDANGAGAGGREALAAFENDAAVRASDLVLA